MLSDIEIIKKSKMNPMVELIKGYDILEEECQSYGKYMAKVNCNILKRLQNKPDGKLILVSAITPTPAGEGKSTTTIGLVDSLNRIGKKCVGALREPSLGPVFGVKGGAAGGGYAQVNPMAELNLHFTGDIHAITTANNLVSAIIDNHIFQGNALRINPEQIMWKRCMDLNDRSLRQVQVGLSSKKETPRMDSFNISVASEIMAMLCLSKDLADLRNRLDRTLVAYTYDNQPITIKDLGITGSLLVLLKDAMHPNIVQTLENNMMFVHGGPFANIAHGCNSINATKIALKIADYVVTEAGFGVDLGAEKFMDIKCREADLHPSLVVVVATIRALKYHGGVDLKQLKTENVEALKKGLENLEKHIETLDTFGVARLVAINRFESDTQNEIDTLMNWAKEHGVAISLSEVFAKGSAGGEELAKAVLATLKDQPFTPLYEMNDSVFDKIEKIVKKSYGANGVIYEEKAKAYLDQINTEAYQDYYIVMAKTQNSISDNPKVIGRPKDFFIRIKEVRLATGSKFIICLTGDIMTMPGLNKEPLALKIDMNDQWEIFGLM